MTVNTNDQDIPTPGTDGTATAGSATLPTALPVGTTVEVRSRFDRRWAKGFAVAASSTDAYQVRRLSDGSVLPAWFPHDEIRQIVLR
jgi:hypothetical protein